MLSWQKVKNPGEITDDAGACGIDHRESGCGFAYELETGRFRRHTETDSTALLHRAAHPSVRYETSSFQFSSIFSSSSFGLPDKNRAPTLFKHCFFKGAIFRVDLVRKCRIHGVS